MFRAMLPRMYPQMRRKLSAAKTMVVTGEAIQYTRRYCTAWAAKSPSAPIMAMRAGAARYSTAPMAAPVPTMSRQAQVKMLLASWSSLRPRAMEMGTAEPTPIRSAREKLMMTKGMARFRAAKAVLPTNCPTNRPSSRPYRAEASMLTAPGMAAMKNSFTGGVLANRVLESKLSPPPSSRRGRGPALAAPGQGGR